MKYILKHKHNNKTNRTNKMIYRYTFTQSFQENLQMFGQTYKHLSRKEFKETWKQWFEKNRSMIDQEYKYMNEQNKKSIIVSEIDQEIDQYTAFEVKIYTSVRYYHCKKAVKESSPPTPTPTPIYQENVIIKKRKAYEHHFSKEILQAMDKHISETSNESMAPSKKFQDYFTKHCVVYKTIDADLSIEAKEEEMKRMKKVYKNRYYKKNI